MATPASSTSLHLSGNIVFLAGGMAVDSLTGLFLKSADISLDNATLTIIFQDADGVLQSLSWTPPTGSGGGITLEQARDTVAAMITAGAGINVAYVDDGDNAGTLTITADLSDAAPRSVSTGQNSPGTSDEMSRRDHHHQVSAASTIQSGVSEYATNAESLDFHVDNLTVYAARVASCDGQPGL